MTTKENVLEALRNKQAKTISREDLIAEWKEKIDNLFSLIESWLETAKKEELVRVSRSPISIDEEDLGPYQIDKLVVFYGGLESSDYVEFRPYARMVFLAQGRVDVWSSRNCKLTSLLRRDDNWFIYQGEGQKIDFNEDFFWRMMAKEIQADE
ncbi:hypothetical protein L6R29_13470 [Myxococcota bacterium]|nr:hypothetical protein [Myxococcota bacterium]